MNVSSTLKSQIDFLHEKVRGKEWCGPLIYKILSGDINNPNDLTIQAEGLYLMNIGTAGYTDFKMDEESTVDMFNQYPDLEEMRARTGFIHTHHSMSTGFSATDNEELAENTENYPSYVSLIVNYEGKYSARVAFVTTIQKEINQTTSYKNVNNESINNRSTYTEEKKVVCYYDCDVSIDRLITQSFMDRYDKINSQQSTNVIGYGSYGKPYQGYSGYSGPKRYNHNKATLSTYANMRLFAAKMIEEDPKLLNKNLESIFNKYKHFYKEDEDISDMIDIVDECLEATIGANNYNKLTIKEKYEFFENVDEMLNEEFPKRMSHVSTYACAQRLSEFLKMLTQTEEELTWV